ncbi:MULTISPECIES: MarR family winged helix-turn-helix transcriptional regulator [Streptomyces]|uniref:DNA-binding MarR family transcriptional regulator n=1 Tax=Streptomyces stelliscabiei TaxID=146820 RepID=A0A8I0P157_9ACTN|nr:MULTISPECIES: helix-turn-helix domain-containing protein [Streptomyces]KND45880.1 MarR family transcriptional regulator [Streptomyces stelliscabiei]MBE1594359.1 DNA-binding MarR family transcriptional regulator [Streptomyces stelliscabiei]MDX2522059.1 helix-turn-helix domain-containing protein [Streptomyces stelliscabiei]MDX2557966.1 helix-turn-helix domain-containing protein [Streptomyces stelliscabiei]MDX2617769.1 helix-turn-helix domain-containing protein [Streptomyces stelliscabiei]
MNGVELFLLGRTLMKIGEQAMPPAASGAPGSARSVLVVLGDLLSHPGTTVGEIAARTGLPQSQVSTAVARLEQAGSVETEPDPSDRRRRLVRPAAMPSARVAEVRATAIDDTLAAALTGADGVAPGPDTIREVTQALDLLARRLTPSVVARARDLASGGEHATPKATP